MKLLNYAKAFMLKTEESRAYLFDYS